MVDRRTAASSETAAGHGFTVLHVLTRDKFTESFIGFVEEHDIDFARQLFFCVGRDMGFLIARRDNVIFGTDFLCRPLANFALFRKMYRARKIVIHGLWDTSVTRWLAAQPWLLSKAYWVIWGGDLYRYLAPKRSLIWHINELARRVVIRRMGHLLTYVPGDVDLARQWYGATGRHHECLMYLSNVFKHADVPQKVDTSLCVQIGNSADPGNRHIEMLDMLEPFKYEDIRIFAPLTYGDAEYAARVAAAGERRFGDKFVAMTEFLPFDAYLEFLAKIDIAMFNHRRQQAMGNIITLLGLGKTVCLRRDTTSWDVLTAAGIELGDLQDFRLVPQSDDAAQRNVAAVQAKFSVNALETQWADILK